MYQEIFPSSGNELVQSRLDSLSQTLRQISYSTQEELHAQVISLLNAILAIGNNVSPLRLVRGETPAVIGDVTENLQTLNNDAYGIMLQLFGLETDASHLFNLVASTQNSLRQQVREQAYLTTRKRYLETFINESQIDSATASFDFGVGMATGPFVKETQVTADSIVLGTGCDGSLDDVTNGLGYLTDGLPETSMVWNGAQIELVVTFNTPTILNRVKIELDDYQGLNLEMLTTSPDGIIQQDILAGLLYDSRSLDGSSNKFSGDVVLDFDAQHVNQMRIIISDRVGTARIALRDISFIARQYQSAGLLTSKKIDNLALGMVIFRAEQATADQLTNITHQVSYDGVHFAALTPDTQFDLGGKPFWYRALLERLDSNFELMARPVPTPGQDPLAATYYKLGALTAIDVGNNILERTINLDLLSQAVDTGARPIQLREVPLPGTLSVYQGTALLGPQEYQFTGNAINFSGNDERAGVLIRYQTSVYANAGLTARPAKRS